jgi:recombination protein RecR
MSSQSLTKLIEQLSKLPGIGKKSAERLAYHILRIHETEALALADAIRSLKQNLRYCETCYNLAEGPRCAICQDASRDQHVLCVVEQPRDLIALEETGAYRGLYHVLLGRIAPLEGIGPEHLTIDALIQRVRHSTTREGATREGATQVGGIQEIVMATNPTVEGDGTALYISNLLSELPVTITRLARGITTGSVLEFANKEMLTDALSGRQRF